MPKDDNSIESSSWTRLGKGTLTEVWTDGERLKRPLRPWSDAIHQVLEHFGRGGVCGVPRLVEVEDASEILTLLPGRAIRRPWPEAVQSTRWMEQVGRWLRQVHTATSDFRLAGGAQFVWGPEVPEPGHVVTHGDLGTWNMLEQDGDFVGVIDWDLARFGDPLDDLAETVFELGPLRENRNMLAGSAIDERVRARVASLCRGYGKVSLDDVLRHVEPLYQRRIDEMTALATGGEAPFSTLAEAGNLDALFRDLAHFQRRFKPSR